MLPIALTLIILLALATYLLLRERQARQELDDYRQLLAEQEQGLLRLDASACIRWCNPVAAQLLGKTASELRGRPIDTCLPALNDSDSQCIALADPPGTSLKVSRLPAADGHGSLLLLQRLSEPARSGDDAERFQRSQYFARIGTWDWDIDTNRLYWSEAIYAMFGHQPGTITPSYELFCHSVHPDDRQRVRAGELRCIETGENHDEEYRVIWPDGSVHWLRETGNVTKDASGTPLKMMGVVRDITEEKAWASQMHQLAHHDALTGLPNRLVFEDRLRSALERARRSNLRVALVFIDLNGFKTINDTHGHVAGDQVLVATARRLKAALRESDSVARIGGDEFVVILEGLALERQLEEEARAIGEKILTALALPLADDSSQRRIDASLGIAAFPDHAPSMDRLIHLADQAMYEAKRSGDNQYRLGRSGQQRASVD
ncbi:diguanylate cyclase domain-containing protein [Aquipseudomonas alcaligenes]|uniref:diguanylate cyclase domain-containing protein n=1 Tax=Aquipseudomonas alcaligenes TaxID=43263 RepID=UPI001658D3EA|nr:diguanylate cyclase [Pseudomonas alcaligenes]